MKDYYYLQVFCSLRHLPDSAKSNHLEQCLKLIWEVLLSLKSIKVYLEIKFLMCDVKWLVKDVHHFLLAWMLCSQMTSRKVGVNALKPFFAKIDRTEIFHKTSFTMMIRMLVGYLNSGNMSASDPCVIRFRMATWNPDWNLGDHS